jgi:hypothetical protein
MFINLHKRLFSAVAAASMLLAHTAAAAVVARAAVPAPQYADGEASAETMLPAPGPADRVVEVTLAFTASPTNNAELALVGSLRPEADATLLTVAWDLGEWVVTGPRPGQRLSAAAAGPSAEGPRELLAGLRLDRAGAPARVWLTERAGSGAPVAIGFGPGAQETILSWLAEGPGAWDTLRAASRGGAGPVSASAGFTADASIILVR